MDARSIGVVIPAGAHRVERDALLLWNHLFGCAHDLRCQWTGSVVLLGGSGNLPMHQGTAGR